MKTARPLLSATLLVLLTLAGASRAQAAAMFTRVAANAPQAQAFRAAHAAAAFALPHTTLMTVDADAITAFRTANGGTLDVPAADGGTFSLTLEPSTLLAPGATLTYTDDAGAHALPTDISIYKGTVAGEAGSWAVISLSPRGAMGTVYSHGTHYQLMPAEKAAAGALPLHALAADEDLRSEGSSFKCGVDGDNELSYTNPSLVTGGRLKTNAELGAMSAALPSSAAPITPDATQLNATRVVFDIALDCDYEIYANKFSSDLTAATNYVLTVLATSSLIYERDLEYTLHISYLNLWTTSSDPYNQATTSLELPEFQNYWNANRTGISRSLVHMISGRALGGGIAYIGVACNSTSGYGLSAIDAAYSYPNNTSTWDVEVISHEMGHNFGSYHTHSCQWASLGLVPAKTTLDSCQASEGGCATYANHVPPDKGTIMSYCHLLQSVASGIRLDFHPVCITRMRAVSGSVGCQTNPAVAPPRVPVASSTTTGAHLAWTASSSANVLRYDVYRSRTQLDLNPVKAGSTVGTTFDEPGLGTTYYKIRTIRAADSSAFCAEMKVNTCAFTPTASISVGSIPTQVTSADFNHDGITDLAAVNYNSASITVALGQGAAGIGNGTFAAPATVTTGNGPVGVLAYDFNRDGITDLLVVAQGDNALDLHLGNGAGGVGDGTFAAASVMTLAFSPSAVAVADFDEDGVPDLAVAGDTQNLYVMRGLAVNGVPTGAFDTPQLVTVGGGTRGVLVADFNHDGIWDIATTGSGVNILLGQGSGGKGDGTFGPPTIYNVGATPNDMATADFNLDGNLDLVVCNAGASSLSYLAGIGDGTFAPPVSVPCGTGPQRASVADWNQDGIPDVAIANSSSAKVASVLISRGDGTFEPAQTFAALTSPNSVALGDFNHDGGVDMAISNRGSAAVLPLISGCHPSISTNLTFTTPTTGATWVGNEERVLQWTKGLGITLVNVELSRDNGVSWTPIAEKLGGSSFTWTVTGSYTTQARIRVVDVNRPQFASLTPSAFTIIPASALGVNDARLTHFGIVEAWPNPVLGTLSVALTLPQGGHGSSLDLIDLAGRRVATRNLSALGTGLQRVDLLHGSQLPPGVYLVRLIGPGETHSLKVAVLH